MSHDDNIAVLGLSGRFPESASVSEFLDNLFGKVDMLTTDDRRWPAGALGIPERHGQLKDIEGLDANFFRIHGGQASKMDPQLRLLLECTFEALNDAGISPAELKGSNTGVFIGGCFSDMHDYTLRNADDVLGYENTGCAHSMFSNRISFTYDWNGPSFTVDTACSSSLVAMVSACKALRDGDCDFAVVGGCSVTMRPEANLAFDRLHMLSPDGACKSFDTSANGYARSEAVGVVLLCRPGAAQKFQCRKPYAYLRSFGCNNDGFTAQGITFPNVEAQIALNAQVCKASGLDPSEIDYVEAHGTGTIAGDGVELKALDTVYGLAHSPEKPLLLGSVKSNMGHSEGAAAIVSFIKVCLAFDRNELPPNLHFNNPNSSTTDCLATGRVKVVDEATPFHGKYVAISSFGFGGTNAHVILERGESNQTQIPTDIVLPQWLKDNIKLAFGRTEEGAAHLLELAQAQPDTPTVLGPPVLNRDPEWVQGMYPVRASSVRGNVETNSIEGAPQRPLWFVFTGNGGMWTGMGREMYHTSEIFRQTIDESHEVGKEVGCDIKKIMFEEGIEEDKISPAEAMMCQVAIQIALIRVWREIGVEPEGYLGHSAGEIPAGYLDGALDLRQAILVAYWRNEVIAQASLASGSMYAVGLPREEAQRHLEGLDLCCIGCVNDPSGMTLSGASEQLDPLAAKLKEAGVFCKHVNTKGIAHHSPMLEPLHDHLVRELDIVIPNPAVRSSKWISTCCVEGRAHDDEIAKTCSSRYFARNFVSAVEFVHAMSYVPQNAIVVEIGPHALLASPIRRTRPDLLYIPTMKKGMDSVQTVAGAVGHGFRVGGLDFLVMQSTQNPVAQQINDRKLREALVAWDHSMHFPVPKFLEIQAQSQKSGAEVKYDIQGDHHFLLEHVIDDKPLMPAASYVYAVWQAYAGELRKDVNEVGIRLKQFVIHQAIPIREDTDEVKLRVSFGATKSGYRAVEVTRDGELICSGSVAGIADPTPVVEDGEVNSTALESFSQTAFYTAIKKHGYDYAPLFRPVHSIRRDGRTAVMQWIPESHYVSFIDGLLQCLLNPMSSKAPLLVPTTLSTVTLYPLGGDRSIHRQTPVTIEPWRNAAFTAWGEITGVQMKPLKRNKADAMPSISEEVWVPIGQQFVSDHKDPRSADRAVYANQLIAHQIKVILQHFESSTEHAVAAAKSVVQKQADFLTKYGDDVAESDETAMMQALREVAASIESSTTLQSMGAAIQANKHWADALKSDLLLGYNLWLEPLFEIVEQTIGDELAICEINAGASSLSETLVHKTAVEAISAVCNSADDAEAVNAALGSLGTVETVQWDVSKAAPAALNEKFTLVAVRNIAVATDGKLESFHNIISTVAPGGFVLLMEAAGLLPILTIGLGLSGSAIGPAQWATPEAWTGLCEQVGLNIVVHAVSEDGHQQALLLRKPFKQGLTSTVIDSTSAVLEGNGFNEWKQQLLAAEGTVDRVVLRSESTSGMVGTYRCLLKERHSKARLRLSDNASDASLGEEFDIGIVRKMADGSSTTPVHLPFSVNITTASRGNAQGPRKGVYLKFEIEGDLNSARWLVNDQQPGSDEVVDVHAAALNFKDVMLAYGKIDQSAFYGRPRLPRSVGFEFAGVCRATGERVMGMADDAIATVVHVPKKNMWTVPADWTLENAATVPVVYATAYHALIVRARLRQGQSVLIHAGTGGVGQAAIRIALQRGCEVFTTCSTQAKRQFLLSTFTGLTDDHILNSRSAGFESEVMRLTHGKGVNVVLNSLADEKLQASIRCVAQHGHFCEIGKYDIMEHTPIDMHALVRNITIHGIDVDQIQFDEYLWKETYDIVQAGIQSGEVVPLPVTGFDADDVVEMFRFMAEGKHIGKVVLRMDNEEAVARIESTAKPALTEANAETFIITGGLGGFGLAMAQWFAEKGVKHLVLSSRSGVRSGDQQNAIEYIQSLGTQVTVSTADLTSEVAVADMLKQAGSVAPVVALFHLAMVLEDSRFENMCERAWARVLQPKVAGTIVLDKMTREHCPSLQHFVTFSSIAAGMGNGGQTNYAYGNSFMDRVAESRKQAGFPAVSFQWGVIGDVGVAAKTLDDRFLKDVVRPQSLDSCLEVLERCMLAHNSGIVMSYVATKKTADESTGAKDVVAAVLSVLRLPVNATKRTATLDALGMDSMQSVEVQTIVRRIKGKGVPVDELQKMTLDQIDAL